MASAEHGLHEEIISVLARVRRFAFALTGSAADADDLLQATVERVLRKGAPADADMARWMFRICRNIWIDGIRSDRARAAAVERSSPDMVSVVDGEAVAAERIALAQVGAAMDRLPEHQRTALALVAYGGCSYREAAEILGEPVGTIMSRISRARQNLLGLLNRETDAQAPRAGQSGKD